MPNRGASQACLRPARRIYMHHGPYCACLLSSVTWCICTSAGQPGMAADLSGPDALAGIGLESAGDQVEAVG